MDIQTRKIQFVLEFLKLKSEDAVSRFEELLKSEIKEISPLSIEEFEAIIYTSTKDAKEGRTIAAESLLNRIAEWS